MKSEEMNIKQNIARNIAYYRKKNKMSQKMLAEKLNSKVSTISTWERGASTPDIELLFKIGKIFHISITALLGGDSIENNSSIIIGGFEKELIFAYREADIIEKEIVHRTLHVSEENFTLQKISRLQQHHLI